MNGRSFDQNSGFSLLEVIVAILLGSFLITGLIGFVPKISGAKWRRTQDISLHADIRTISLAADREISRINGANSFKVKRAGKDSFVIGNSSFEKIVKLQNSENGSLLTIGGRELGLHHQVIRFEYLSRSGIDDQSEWTDAFKGNAISAIRATLKSERDSVTVLIWDNMLQASTRQNP